jgi:2-haloacid dehalogenase
MTSQLDHGRRTFLRVSGYAVAATAAHRVLAATNSAALPKAILFDAFPIFDPRPVKQLIESLVPAKAQELNELWRSRIFEYQWLRALSGRYSNFQQVVEESLDFATKSLGIDLSAGNRADLAHAYSNLKAWPDAEAALRTLKALGLKTGFLSNMTAEMLRANLRNSGLSDYIDIVLSTDAAKSFKPDPRAYSLACTELNLTKQEVIFVAFAGWDVAGAKWFGLPTYWVNRMQATAEFGVEPDGEGKNLDALVGFVRTRMGQRQTQG